MPTALPVGPECPSCRNRGTDSIAPILCDLLASATSAIPLFIDAAENSAVSTAIRAPSLMRNLEHAHFGPNVAFVDQPGQHVGRAITGVLQSACAAEGYEIRHSRA
jgi:hypothetical protein